MAGSAPRRPGAKLVVSESGELAGSVSGGCVEPAVFHTAMEGIENGKPQMLEFGISEEENIEKIGLAWGGTIHVFVGRLDWEFSQSFVVVCRGGVPMSGVFEALKDV